MPSRKPLQPRKPRRTFEKVGAIVLVVVAVLALIFYLWPKKDLAEIARLKDKAIGLAENAETAAADDVLQELRC